MEQITVGSMVEWIVGPRRLKRSGVVRHVFADGSLEVLTAVKVCPSRRVMPSCNPRLMVSGGVKWGSTIER
jgi:hypothetical protein